MPVFEIRYKKGDKDGRYWIMGNNELIWSDVSCSEFIEMTLILRITMLNVVAAVTAKMEVAVTTAPAVINVPAPSCKFIHTLTLLIHKKITKINFLQFE